MTQEDEIEKLQLELHNDPKSPNFVRLTELYLSREMIIEAETLVRQSLKFLPRSVSGLILFGRILKLQKNYIEAITPLQQATQLAPDNWRAWLELAEAYLQCRRGKESLAAYKKVLFFNPTQSIARRAVAKLETLSADEYEDDLFQMQSLPETHLETTETSPTTSAQNKQEWQEPPEALKRVLSYIDALILRHENKKAIDLLNDCSKKYSAHPEIESRRLQLSSYETPDFIRPKSLESASKSKRELIHDKKIQVLQELLRRIELLKIQSLSTSPR